MYLAVALLVFSTLQNAHTVAFWPPNKKMSCKTSEEIKNLCFTTFKTLMLVSIVEVREAVKKCLRYAVVIAGNKVFQNNFLDLKLALNTNIMVDNASISETLIIGKTKIVGVEKFIAGHFLAVSQILEAGVYTAENRQETTWLKGTGIW